MGNWEKRWKYLTLRQGAHEQYAELGYETVCARALGGRMETWHGWTTETERFALLRRAKSGVCGGIACA